MSQMDLEDDKTPKVVPINNFKSNKLSQLDKKQRAVDVQHIIESGYDEPGTPYRIEAIRLPNKLVHGYKEVGGDNVTQFVESQEIQSPTLYFK